jgi:hypothetical protein
MSRPAIKGTKSTIVGLNIMVNNGNVYTVVLWLQTQYNSNARHLSDETGAALPTASVNLVYR